MKNLKQVTIVAFFVVLAAACSKSEDTPPANNNTGGGNNPTPNYVDSIARKWKVADATHNGSPDNSSKGLELDIRADGSYTLISTGFVGKWEFTDNDTKVLLDKDNSQIKTTWTVKKLTSKRMEVDFKSPFTGGNAHWDMDAQ